jgi:hypothetical protein
VYFGEKEFNKAEFDRKVARNTRATAELGAGLKNIK